MVLKNSKVQGWRRLFWVYALENTCDVVQAFPLEYWVGRWYPSFQQTIPRR